MFVPARMTRSTKIKEIREKTKGKKFRIGCLPAIFATTELRSKSKPDSNSLTKSSDEGAPRA